MRVARLTIRRIGTLWVILAACLLGGVGIEGCHPPVTVTTPQGKIAYTADQISTRVTEFERVVIDLNAQNQIPTETTRTILEACRTLQQTLQTTPQGWQASAVALWAGIKRQVPPLQNPALLAAINGVDLVLAAYGG